MTITNADVAAYVAAAAAIGSACATLYGASVAKGAADVWRANLRQQRIDECIAAVTNCAGAIGRTVSLKLANTVPATDNGIGEAWAAWRTYRISHNVAKSYLPRLPDSILTEGTQILEGLSRFNGSAAPADALAGNDLNRRFGVLVSEVETTLRARAGAARAR